MGEFPGNMGGVSVKNIVLARDAGGAETPLEGFPQYRSTQ